ncbi:MAG TPA: heptaprenyl diphosphate synthase [Clostridiales bacterium]|nr:heptaprenyl diphosphate synthase [Clostridiales bacterium]
MRKMVMNGILISMAIVISYFERLIPLGMIIPLPGIKLGLANIVTLFALFYLGFQSAFFVTVIRCVIVSLLFGSLTSLIFSLSGGLLALLVMWLLKFGYDGFFSMIGVSVGGAAAHNTGQIIAASFILKSTVVFGYLPFLLLSSLITGVLTALASESLFYHMRKLYIFDNVMGNNRGQECKDTKHSKCTVIGPENGGNGF